MFSVATNGLFLINQRYDGKMPFQSGGLQNSAFQCKTVQNSAFWVSKNWPPSAVLVLKTLYIQFGHPVFTIQFRSHATVLRLQYVMHSEIWPVGRAKVVFIELISQLI